MKAIDNRALLCPKCYGRMALNIIKSSNTAVLNCVDRECEKYCVSYEPLYTYLRKME